MNNTDTYPEIEKGIYNDDEIFQFGKCSFIPQIINNSCNAENKIEKSSKEKSSPIRKSAIDYLFTKPEWEKNTGENKGQ